MDDKLQLDPEQTQVVLEWALATAAIVIMLASDEEPTTEEEAVHRVHTLEHAAEIMHQSIPDFMYDFAMNYAISIQEETEAEEQLVEQFKKELDALDGDS